MTQLVSSVQFFFAHGRLPVRDRYYKRSNGQWRVRYILMGYGGLSAALSFLVLSAFSAVPLLPFGGDTYPAALVRAADPDSPDTTDLVDNRAHTVNPVPIIPKAKPDVPMATLLGLFREPEQQVIDQVRTTATQLASVALHTSVRASGAASDKQSSEPRSAGAPVGTAPVVATVGAAPLGAPGDTPAAGKNLTIAAGDTLSTLLVRAGLSEDDTDRAIQAIRPHLRPSDLRPGQTLSLEMSTPNAPYQFHRLSLAVDPVRSVEVKRGWGGMMTASIIEKPLKRDFGVHVAVVKSSLYGSAAAAGVPNNVISEAIKALGHQIDFQRDIHPGDKLEIMYDRRVTDDGYVAKMGNLVYARLYADGRQLTIYRYDFKDGRVEYLDEKGRSIRKALLRTPLDGARVTSGFGMRLHPLMGYSKMHKGVDFGASIGTPIYAAGDGVVEKAERFGAYGNYIRIKHNGRLSTAYAHLSRYGAGIRNGMRVRQGQVIGYVGTTGRSTGPHLHYEVLVGGDQINPQSVKLPTGMILEGKELKSFRALVDRTNRVFHDRVNGMRYAAVDPTIVQ